MAERITMRARVSSVRFCLQSHQLVAYLRGLLAYYISAISLKGIVKIFVFIIFLLLGIAIRQPSPSPGKHRCESNIPLSKPTELYR